MDTDSFVHFGRPLAQAPGTASTSPLNVVIHAQALFAILDHSLRRSLEQNRVIGTLLGVRSEDGSEIEIRNCFAVGHNESQEQVEVDMDHHKAMYNLHLKANPKEILVGWYATSPELDTFSALIQNFYASTGDGTGPHPAVHLTISSQPGKDISCRTYISSTVGTTTERTADSCLFVPVPYEIRYSEAEKNGLETLSLAKNTEDRQVGVVTDIESLEHGLEEVMEMLERVSAYVGQATNGEVSANPVLGHYLMNTLSLAPKVDTAEIEKMFNTHLQDVLLVSYLANTIRTQLDLSSKLASASAIISAPQNQNQKPDNKRQPRERE